MTEIHPLWRTARAYCELTFTRGRMARVLVWVGVHLVYQQTVMSYADAVVLADQLRAAYG
jgi:hypothetical protein